MESPSPPEPAALTETSAEDRAKLEQLRAAFSDAADDRGTINPKSLRAALKLKTEFIAVKLFELFDRDSSGAIEKDEFVDAIGRVVFGSQRDKLSFLFGFHDHDHDGFIIRAELDRLIYLGLAENRLELPRALVEQMIDALFEQADADDDGRITFEEFSAVLARYPEVLERVTEGRAVWSTMRQEAAASPPRSSLARRFAHYLEAHGAELLLLALYMLVNLLLFAGAVERYALQGANGLVQLARGCGACLNFNGALILVPMMRRLMTWLRATPAARVIPVDASVGFHKLVGHVMFGFAIVHTLAHFGNYLVLEAPFFDLLLRTRAGLTGLLLMLVFGFMWFFALDQVRRSGHFELFYFSHLGYFAWFALALVHGPVFWIWALAPVLGYLVGRALRLRQRVREAEVAEVNLLPSAVTNLQIARPPGWEHRAGDYLFLCVPELARHEWHPFTISSAPEQRETVSVHVRSLGNWTKALHALCQQREALAQRGAPPAPLKVYLEGPFGTPSAHIFESQHAVLVGAGIGVTPFAAIIQSILLRARSGGQKSALRKVHFIWINRDQHAFEWFVELLAQAERDAAEVDVELDIQIYMTGGRDDLKSASLVLARELLYARTRADLVTGLRARTNMGRPDWEPLLTAILREHAPGRVDLFMCGPRGLVRVLRPLCQRLGMGFRHEVF